MQRAGLKPARFFYLGKDNRVLLIHEIRFVANCCAKKYSRLFLFHELKIFR